MVTPTTFQRGGGGSSFGEGEWVASSRQMPRARGQALPSGGPVGGAQGAGRGVPPSAGGAAARLLPPPTCPAPPLAAEGPAAAALRPLPRRSAGVRPTPPLRSPPAGPRRPPHRPRSRPPGASSMGECGPPGRASPCRPAGLAASAPARGGARARGIAGRPGSLGRGRINGRAGPAPSPRQAGAQPAASFGEGLLAVEGRRRSRNQGCGGPNCAPCRGALHHPFPWPCKLTGAGSLFFPLPCPLRCCAPGREAASLEGTKF